MCHQRHQRYINPFHVLEFQGMGFCYTYMKGREVVDKSRVLSHFTLYYIPLQ